MKDRIIEFLKAENKSSAQFAAEIGVQPSGISHILSGRNNPSLDFVIRMLEKYRYLSLEWLLFGRGKMYKENKMPTLFDELDDNQPVSNNVSPVKPPVLQQNAGTYKETEVQEIRNIKKSAIRRIVWFYDNNEFEEFLPASDNKLP